MKRIICLLLLVASAGLSQQQQIIVGFHHDETPLAAVPTSAADAFLPSVAGSNVIIRSMYFVNTNASTTRTVTVTCKTTGTTLVVAAIPGYTSGGNNIPVQLPADGVSCAGGVRWVADGAGVNGSVTGTYQ